MVNLCSYEDCSNTATYGYKQQEPVTCKEHKEPGMVYGPLRYCEHGRQRSHCKECGGKSICEHNRQRSHCKECGGASICEHNRIRSRCKECGGGEICEHGKRRSKCKECGGTEICEHERQRSCCKECGGGGICEHNRIRSQCKECGGASICEHGKRRSQCKECGGASICEHGRHRSSCKECGGASICEHGKVRRQCHKCSPDSNYFCVHCKYSCANKKYKNHCMLCFVNLFPDDPISKNARLKTKELEVKAFLFEQFPEKFKHNKQLVIGDCTFPYRRYIDFHCMVKNTLVAIEVDENQHRGYDQEDEELRINEILHNIGFDKKMVFIRFNPDSFTENGKRCNVRIKNRLERLKTSLKDVFDFLETNEFRNIHTEIKLFYDS